MSQMILTLKVTSNKRDSIAVMNYPDIPAMVKDPSNGVQTQARDNGGRLLVETSEIATGRLIIRRESEETLVVFANRAAGDVNTVAGGSITGQEIRNLLSAQGALA